MQFRNHLPQRRGARQETHHSYAKGYQKNPCSGLLGVLSAPCASAGGGVGLWYRENHLPQRRGARQENHAKPYRGVTPSPPPVAPITDRCRVSTKPGSSRTGDKSKYAASTTTEENDQREVIHKVRLPDGAGSPGSISLDCQTSGSGAERFAVESVQIRLDRYRRVVIRSSKVVRMGWVCRSFGH